MRPSTVPAVLLTLIFSLIIFSCTKNENSNSEKAHLKVYLTDDPGNYDEVVIDVKDVQINVTGDSSSGWKSLSSVATGQYNLLDLVNDNDTLLVNTDIPTGRIHQMRLILGDNNYVVIGGQQFDLKTPSAQQSGLKLNIQQDVTAGILYTITLDFDVAKSVHQTGNGQYMLKPVIRTVFNAAGGSIRGYVVPPSVVTAVYVIQGVDTVASTFTGIDGGYLLRGLPQGAYNLSFVPGDTTYILETRNGIGVTTGNVTLVDTIHLHH